jgi:hypothetical protein
VRLAFALIACSFDIHGVSLDLSTSPDLARLADLAQGGDLSSPDLTAPRDLTLLPDLLPPFCPATTSLVACYTFEDAFHPTTLTDGSMYQNDATATGASFPAGKSGAALTLDSAGSARVSDRPSLDIANAITVEAWVKVSSLVQPGQRYGVVDDDAQYSLFVQPMGTGQCSLANLNVMTRANAITIGTWQHWACTYDRQTLRFYLDGKQVASANSTQAIATNGSNGLALAGNSPSGNILDGEIDNVRIWNVSRTAQEICDDAGC